MATGGDCLVVEDTFILNKNNEELELFLEVLEESENTKDSTSRRQKYLQGVKSGKFEKFPWLRLMPKN